MILNKKNLWKFVQFWNHIVILPKFFELLNFQLLLNHRVISKFEIGSVALAGVANDYFAWPDRFTWMEECITQQSSKTIWISMVHIFKTHSNDKITNINWLFPCNINLKCIQFIAPWKLRDASFYARESISVNNFVFVQHDIHLESLSWLFRSGREF